MPDNLLSHLRTERAALRFDDLLLDCRSMSHIAFPRTEQELRRQLSALVRAGLVTWSEGVIEAVAIAEQPDQQRELFA